MGDQRGEPLANTKPWCWAIGILAVVLLALAFVGNSSKSESSAGYWQGWINLVWWRVEITVKQNGD